MGRGGFWREGGASHSIGSALCVCLFFSSRMGAFIEGFFYYAFPNIAQYIFFKRWCCVQMCVYERGLHSSFKKKKIPFLSECVHVIHIFFFRLQISFFFF